MNTRFRQSRLMDDEETKPSDWPETKWGSAVRSGVNGYQLLPDVLLRNQKRLGLGATDLAVLLNITLHWWESEPAKMPHPRPVTIAQRIGVSTRSVERHIARMAKLGLLRWLPPQARKDGPSIRPFDLDGLVKKLQEIAAESEISNIAA
jgi:hypothetical protein